MFIVIKKKWIIFVSIILFIIFLTVLVVGINMKSVLSFGVANSKYTVVIDAGHGGVDGGSVGVVTKVKESELNLAYSKTLAKQLNSMNINTVFTRSSTSGLYDKDAKSLKKSDMKRRKEIIENANPTLVISIHMNSFSSASARGAQVFYKKDNEQGLNLAKCIQTQLKTNIEFGKENPKVGDYYIVNCTDIPCVLVECGFLSNKDDEQLLLTEEYKNKICYSILSGIIEFLNV